MKKSILLSLMWVSVVFGQDLGVCPSYTASDCKKSLSKAVNKICNCKSTDSDVKQCAFIFVETLSSADDNAPFYEPFYKNNYQVGNVKKYRSLIKWLKRKSVSAWLAVHDLSRAMILEWADFETLSEADKKVLKNIMERQFVRVEDIGLSSSTPQSREAFIQAMKKAARAIQWPPEERTIEIE